MGGGGPVVFSWWLSREKGQGGGDARRLRSVKAARRQVGNTCIHATLWRYFLFHFLVHESFKSQSIGRQVGRIVDLTNTCPYFFYSLVEKPTNSSTFRAKVLIRSICGCCGQSLYQSTYRPRVFCPSCCMRFCLVLKKMLMFLRWLLWGLVCMICDAVC